MKQEEKNQKVVLLPDKVVAKIQRVGTANWPGEEIKVCELYGGVLRSLTWSEAKKGISIWVDKRQWKENKLMEIDIDDDAMCCTITVCDEVLVRKY